MLGHEAGLFTPSGSMANQLGVRLHVRPGEELIGDSLAHVVRAELGAAAVLSGISSRTWVSERGRFRADDAASLMITGVGPYQVCTSLVIVENTHNFGGGTVQPLERDPSRARDHARAGRRDAPRRGPPLQRPRRLRGAGRATTAASSTPCRCASARASGAGRQRPRRLGRRDGRVAHLAQALRRRHASGRDPRCRRPFRARPQRRASRRRPRPGPARRRGDGRGRSRLWSTSRPSRPTSSSSTSLRPGGRRRPSSTPRSPAVCARMPWGRVPCASSGTSTSTTPAPTSPSTSSPACSLRPRPA